LLLFFVYFFFFLFTITNKHNMCELVFITCNEHSLSKFFFSGGGGFISVWIFRLDGWFIKRQKKRTLKNINKKLKGGIWGESFAIIASNRAQECWSKFLYHKKFVFFSEECNSNMKFETFFFVFVFKIKTVFFSFLFFSQEHFFTTLINSYANVTNIHTFFFRSLILRENF